MPGWVAPDGADVASLFAELASRARIRARLVIDADDAARSMPAGCRLVDGLGEVHLSGGGLAHLRQNRQPAAAMAAVFGHELGHLASGHIGRLRGPVFALLLGALAVTGGALAALADGNWLALALAICVQPILVLAALVRAAFGERREELAADDYAVALTGDPEALAGVLESLAGRSEPGWQGRAWALLSEYPPSAARAARLRLRARKA